MSSIKPLEGINPNNFSILWEGWIKAPTTEPFTFKIESDDGSQLSINKTVVISDRLQKGMKDWLEPKLKTIRRAASEGRLNEALDPRKKTPI
jgi:hypothetical protein